jgi:hypothetical protein
MHCVLSHALLHYSLAAAVAAKKAFSGPQTVNLQTSRYGKYYYYQQHQSESAPSGNISRRLLLTRITDHLYVRNLHVTMLSIALLHAALLRSLFSIFLYVVHRCIRDNSGRGHCMTRMLGSIGGEPRSHCPTLFPPSVQNHPAVRSWWLSTPCRRLLRCFSVFSEKRPDVCFQHRFHALFGFLKITPAHQDGQAFTNALPTIIFRPKNTLHSNGSEQRYFYSARPHDFFLKFLCATSIQDRIVTPFFPSL